MRWLQNILRGFRRSKIDAVFPKELHFVGEQDGLPERNLKAEWSPILMECQSVARAYLAIAQYDQDDDYHIILGLRSAAGDNLKLVSSLGQPFQKTFNTRQMLDIVFLTESQEEALARVCRPFFSRIS